jgi:hypothetical protein
VLIEWCFQATWPDIEIHRIAMDRFYGYIYRHIYYPLESIWKMLTAFTYLCTKLSKGWHSAPEIRLLCCQWNIHGHIIFMLHITACCNLCMYVYKKCICIEMQLVGYWQCFSAQQYTCSGYFQQLHAEILMILKIYAKYPHRMYVWIIIYISLFTQWCSKAFPVVTSLWNSILFPLDVTCSRI